MDKSRFDTLYVKLFAAVAGTIAVLTLGAWLVFTWTFERGFIDYLERADEMRLERMSDRLEEGYAREGSWAWIADDRQRWSEMSRDALGLPRRRALGTAAPAAPDGSERDTPLTIEPRLLLFDADKNRLIGSPEAQPRAILKPIVVGDKTVGYLGYVPRPEVIESIEGVYLERQHLAFGAVAAGMLIAALALGAGLAHWLARRVNALARGTHALAQGDYAVRLEAKGRDELTQLARDFNALAAALADARDARRQWIADIAHELRTPLSVLRGEIEALQDGVRPLDQAAVASLAGEATRLARLVEDLHTLSMSDSGALTYHKEPVDLAEVVGDVVDAQRRAIAERGLQLDTQLEEAIVLADETRFAQVFANLLQNSLRYTDAPGRIAIRLRREGNRAVVDWEDSAPGVPAGELTRLTERLYRVEGSRNRASGGSGLGLAIARAIVEGHAGTLTARESGLGGLMIEIALPLHTGVNGRG